MSAPRQLLLMVLVGSLAFAHGCAKRGAAPVAPDPAARARARADSVSRARDSVLAREEAIRDSLELAAPDARDRGLTAYRRGAFLVEERRAAEALPFLEEAVRYAPDVAEAHYNLGLARLDLGDSTRAIASFRRAAGLAPNDTVIGRGLAAALVKTGHATEALAEYRRVLELDPRSAEARFALARLEETLGLREAALADWRLFLEQHPEGPWAGEARRRIAALTAGKP